MIGGGPGSFIGSIHRTAARLDGEIELVCGAFSSEAGRSAQTGEELGLPKERVYASYLEMFDRESGLAENLRMDLVSIVTPNHLHFAPARLAIEQGFHLVIDKPMTFDLTEAEQLRQLVAKTGRQICVTYTYTGYPMVKEARQQVAAGNIGAVRKLFVEYPQGWLSRRIEAEGQKQAAWRTDPKQSGAGGAIADIGVHAFNISEYITGLKVVSIFAQLNRVVKGRQLDDDATVLLRFENGATGVLIASQVATGEENNLRIRIYGEEGALEWEQNDANSLRLKRPDHPAQIWRAGSSYLGGAAKQNSRTPAGHPEGWIEAFANHYRNFAGYIRNGEAQIDAERDFPDVEAGYRGMLFIQRAVTSSGEGRWVDL